MDISIESLQPSARTIGRVDPMSLAAAGIARADLNPSIETGSRPYSFLEACECPDDCLRDHGNE